jgi:hypothetical protein
MNNSGADYFVLDNCTFINHFVYALYCGSSDAMVITASHFKGATNGLRIVGACVRNKINNCTFSDVRYGIETFSVFNSIISDCEFNCQYGIEVNSTGDFNVYNCLFNITYSEVIFVNCNTTDPRVISMRHDQTEGNTIVFTEFGSIFPEVNDRPGGSGYKWRVSKEGSARKEEYPLEMVLAEIPCIADEEVTVTVYAKKSYTGSEYAIVKLLLEGNQIAGVPTDVEDVKADDADWEQLSISFTPTENGVVEVKGLVYSNNVPTFYAHFADLEIS